LTGGLAGREKGRAERGEEKERIGACSVSVADASPDPWEQRFVFRVSAGRVDLAVHARVRAGVRAYARVCVNEIQGGSSVSPVGRAGSLACPCPVLACRQRERASTMESGAESVAREKNRSTRDDRCGGTLPRENLAPHFKVGLPQGQPIPQTDGPAIAGPRVTDHA